MESVAFKQLTPSADSDRWLLDGIPFTGVASFEDGGPFCGEVEYRNGIKHGVSRVWWLPTGKLNHEQHWAEGQPEGVCRNWYPDGTLRSEVFYEAGVCVRGRVWDETGVIVNQFDQSRPSPEQAGIIDSEE